MSNTDETPEHPTSESPDPHDHDHGDHDHGDHDHGDHGWRRFLSFGHGHSHDASESIDSELETSRKGLRALLVSFAALMVTALIQAALVAFTGSVALLGDTIHNSADSLTAVPIAVALIVGRRLPTKAFTYGYGRAEDIAGIFVVLVIAGSAALAGYESVQRLFNPQPIDHLWILAAAGILGFAGNELVARYRIKVGREIGSAALVADGLHARTDGFTSLVVVLGAGGVALGFPASDAIVGLAITVAILVVLRDAARQIYRRLMDAVDPELVDRVRSVAAAVPDVRGVGSVKVRWVGHALHGQVEVSVDDGLLWAGHTT